MKELEALLEKRWILKTEDKELYYKVRDRLVKSGVLQQIRWDVKS